MSKDEKCPGCGAALDQRMTDASGSHTYICESFWTPGGHSKAEFCQSWSCLKRQVRALQAIVERLPKTVDEMHVTLHDTVWYVSEDGNQHVGSVHEFHGLGLTWCVTFQMGEFLPGTCDVTLGRSHVRVQDCYSTREAAQAAKETT